ncbi:MAG TPA: hypothetical protein VFB73_01075 [Chloroflexota bacterium]|jgi:hypothetical protein|nr:hypothetical protein [Chloroflexota bacterium]
MPETLQDAAAVVLAALRRAPRRAYFESELAASLRAQGLAPADVAAAIDALAAAGQVLTAEYTCPDPHLPVGGFRLVTALSPDEPPSAAEAAAQARLDTRWEEWLRDFLATHRCG